MPGVLELAEDVLDELQRQLLAAGDQLALDRARVPRGRPARAPRAPRSRPSRRASHRYCRTVVGDHCGPAGTIARMAIHVNSGLEGVIAAETSISLVDGQAGRLLYRGYEIGDLAEHGSYDRVVGLLLDGEWPSADEVLPPVELDAAGARRAARAAHLRCAARRAAHRLLGVRRRAPDGLAADARPGPRADRAGAGRGRRVRPAARRPGADRREPGRPTSAPPPGCCTRSPARCPTRPRRGRWTRTSWSAPSTA